MTDNSIPIPKAGESPPMPLELYDSLDPRLVLTPKEVDLFFQAGIDNPYPIAVLASLRNEFDGVPEIIELYDGSIDRLVYDLPGGTKNALNALVLQTNYTAEKFRRAIRGIPYPQPLSPLAVDNDWLGTEDISLAYRRHGSSIERLAAALEDALDVSLLEASDFQEARASRYLFMHRLGLW